MLPFDNFFKETEFRKNNVFPVPGGPFKMAPENQMEKAMENQ